MRKYLFITALIICVYVGLTAQEVSQPKPRIYLSRIDVRRSQYPLKGILYDIKDSSVLFTPEKSMTNLSAGKFMVTQINYSDIIKVKARKINSIKTGAIIGSALGLISVLASMPEDETGISTGATVVLYGIPIAAVYGTVGALIGSIGMRVPINGSYEKFSEQRGELQKFAYLKNHRYRLADHSSFIGITDGPSFPIGDFGSSSPGSENAGFAMTGYMSKVINIGYTIKEKFGISVKGFYSQYSIKESGPGEWWGSAGLLVGPMYSLPVIRVLSIDLSAEIGFATTNLAQSDNSQTGSTGFAAEMNAGLRYNFAYRWTLLTDAGFFFSNLSADISGLKKIETIHLGVGIGYRFN